MCSFLRDEMCDSLTDESGALKTSEMCNKEPSEKENLKWLDLEDNSTNVFTVEKPHKIPVEENDTQSNFKVN